MFVSARLLINVCTFLYLVYNSRAGIYESLEGPLLKKENIFYLVITRKLTRKNEITNSF